MKGSQGFPNGRGRGVLYRGTSEQPDSLTKGAPPNRPGDPVPEGFLVFIDQAPLEASGEGLGHD